MAGSPYGAKSGLDPTNTAYPAGDNVVGNSRVLGNEIFGAKFPSLADQLQNSPREDAKWQFPTLDGAKNTVGGMSAAIENSIKDVERLKKGLIGNNQLMIKTDDFKDIHDNNYYTKYLKNNEKIFSWFISIDYLFKLINIDISTSNDVRKLIFNYKDL